MCDMKKCKSIQSYALIDERYAVHFCSELQPRKEKGVKGRIGECKTSATECDAACSKEVGCAVRKHTLEGGTVYKN